MRMMRGRAIGIIAAIALVAAAVGLAVRGWTSGESSGAGAQSASPFPDRVETGANRTSVLLIVLDTLRADRLGCYGYPLPTSPNIDALAEESVRFTRAISTAPWTLPAHASLFTGLFPFEHGVHRVQRTAEHPGDSPAENSGDPTAPQPEASASAPAAQAFDPNVRSVFLPEMDAQHATLAEFLLKRGYRTAAFIANAAMLDRRFRLDAGFEQYVIPRTYELHEPRLKPPASEIVAPYLAWLDVRQRERDAERPNFVFLNFMDTHVPFRSGPRPGLPEAPLRPIGHKRMYEEVDRMQRGQPLSDRFFESFSRQYDQAVANLDEDVGRMFAAMREKGCWDDWMIIVLADHGECLGEHSYAGHVASMHEPVLRVPLIVKYPRRRAGSVDDRLISLADVPRLITAAIGEMDMEASRVFPHAIGSHPVVAENYYPAEQRPAGYPAANTIFRAVYQDDFKLVFAPTGWRQLYNLRDDASELRDRSEEFPDVCDRLKDSLTALERSRPTFAGFRPAAGTSGAKRNQLHGLGYLQDDQPGDDQPETQPFPRAPGGGI